MPAGPWSMQVHSYRSLIGQGPHDINGDFEQYWHYHLEQGHERVHCSRYATVRPDQLALAA
jgi:hypothetical protein